MHSPHDAFKKISGIDIFRCVIYLYFDCLCSMLSYKNCILPSTLKLFRLNLVVLSLSSELTSPTLLQETKREFENYNKVVL